MNTSVKRQTHKCHLLFHHDIIASTPSMSQSNKHQTSAITHIQTTSAGSPVPITPHHDFTPRPSPHLPGAPALHAPHVRLPPDTTDDTPHPLKPALPEEPLHKNPSSPSITQSRHRRHTTFDVHPNHGSGTHTPIFSYMRPMR
jgi:hypothetical protein